MNYGQDYIYIMPTINHALVNGPECVWRRGDSRGTRMDQDGGPGWRLEGEVREYLLCVVEIT